MSGEDARPTRVSLIVAMAENGVIGRGNQLPWRLPDDLRRFKRVTMGSPIIMGRRTHESIGGVLPGRRNVVLSRNPLYEPDGVEVFASLAEALAATADAAEAFIIGGAALFAEGLELSDRIHLTLVHAAVEGDVRFPRLELDTWTLLSDEPHPEDATHEFAYSVRVYDRQKPTGD